MTEQLTMLPADEQFTRTWQQAERWAHTEGGAMVLRDLYELASRYVPAWKATGIPVGMFLLIGLERHNMKVGLAHAQKGDVRLRRSYGYTLNNSYAPYIARHIMEHRPEWKGLFETRELKTRATRKTVVIREAVLLRGEGYGKTGGKP